MCDDHVCDMHNRLLCIVILLQLVVDSNCYYWYQYGVNSHGKGSVLILYSLQTPACFEKI